MRKGATITEGDGRLNERRKRRSVENNLWNNTTSHIKEFSDRHEADKGENGAEDEGDDYVPRRLVLNRNLTRARERGAFACHSSRATRQCRNKTHGSQKARRETYNAIGLIERARSKEYSRSWVAFLQIELDGSVQLRFFNNGVLAAVVAVYHSIDV